MGSELASLAKAVLDVLHAQSKVAQLREDKRQLAQNKAMRSRMSMLSKMGLTVPTSPQVRLGERANEPQRNQKLILFI